jgi:hypothetical protein
MLVRIDNPDRGDNWLLVPQIAHARLSGQLATDWSEASLRTIEPRAELLTAIARHDEGWADWDATPGVDATTGRPLSFLEMPQSASIEIWQKSISAAEALGPLAAHVVSAHFTTLLQNAGSRWSADPRQFQIARKFLDEYSENRERWLAEWQHPEPTRRTRKVVDRALHYLQFFDMLSLWLCGADRYETETITTPEGTDVTFQPLGKGSFTMRPWLLAEAPFTATVPVRRVPVGHYISREALAAGPFQFDELEFEITPAV